MKNVMKNASPASRSPAAGPVAILTCREKSQLAGRSFQEVTLDGADFSGANLQGASFLRSSLRGCDFRGADLRGAAFLRCDLRGVALGDALLDGNRFHGSCLAEATGLSDEQNTYVCRRGGTFMAWSDGDRPRSSQIE
jgi:uncharacterized protein YjbI with pentapeptide repeats